MWNFSNQGVFIYRSICCFYHVIGCGVPLLIMQRYASAIHFIGSHPGPLLHSFLPLLRKDHKIKIFSIYSIAVVFTTSYPSTVPFQIPTLFRLSNSHLFNSPISITP